MQSRIKMLEKVERLEVPPERKRIHFQFPAAVKSGRMVFELKGACKAYGAKTVLDGVNLHIERGDRIALVGHNGAGKSTLMRLLSAEEAPDAGTRAEGHQVVMQYFAQDEATRLDPTLTVYETLSAGSPTMVPMIRNILGGFLFSGDDVYKKAGVLSGGERTRLAVARMLLRPSNTLLLDEPTNHLDIDSKEVPVRRPCRLWRHAGLRLARPLLRRKTRDQSHRGRRRKGDAVSGDVRGVFVEQGSVHRVPQGARGAQGAQGAQRAPVVKKTPSTAPEPKIKESYEDRKRDSVEKKKRERRLKALKDRVAELEKRIAEREKAIKDVEEKMSAPDFYSDHEKSKRSSRNTGVDVGSRGAPRAVGNAARGAQQLRRHTKFVTRLRFCNCTST